MTFLRSDLFRNFSIGFLLGAAGLFFAQPADTRSELAQDLGIGVAVAQTIQPAA